MAQMLTGAVGRISLLQTRRWIFQVLTTRTLFGVQSYAASNSACHGCSSRTLLLSCEHLKLNENFCRSMASKNIKKDKGKEKNKAKPINISDEEFQQIVDFSELDTSLKNLVEEYKETLTKQFSLRTSSASFDAIKVEIDGKSHPLNSLVQITFKTPQLVMLNFSHQKSHIPTVVKALESSGMNLSPQVEGHFIYIPVPKVSREHRELLAKNAKATMNKFKERLRAIQNQYLRSAKNQSDKSEDLIRNVVNMVMERTDRHGKEMDVLLEAKQKDLLASQ